MKFVELHRIFSRLLALMRLPAGNFISCCAGASAATRLINVVQCLRTAAAE